MSGMNLSILKQKLRYHWKKYLAVLFACLAWACLVGSMAVQIVDFAETGINTTSFNWVWNLVFAAVVYGTILVGNVRGTSLAYFGILWFVFSSVFTTVMDFIMYGIFDAVLLFSGDMLTAVSALISILFAVLSAVSGIMLYIRIRGFLSNRYASYAGLRNWAIAFCLLSIVSSISLPVWIGINFGFSWTLIVSCFAEIGDCFIAAAIFFTVTRLKSEY